MPTPLLSYHHHPLKKLHFIKLKEDGVLKNPTHKLSRNVKKQDTSIKTRRKENMNQNIQANKNSATKTNMNYKKTVNITLKTELSI